MLVGHCERSGSRGNGVGVGAIGNDTILNELSRGRAAHKLRVVGEKLDEVDRSHIGALVRLERVNEGESVVEPFAHGLVREGADLILDDIDGDEVERAVRSGVVRHVVFRVPFDV